MIPKELDKKINEILDEALKNHPDAITDRESLYRQLLQYYDENGELPEKVKLICADNN